MYIEFPLPSGAGGLAAQHARHAINQCVHKWADKFNIPFKTKTVKYTHRIILTCAEHYTLFGMSFDPSQEKYATSLSRWRFVEPMSIDKEL